MGTHRADDSRTRVVDLQGRRCSEQPAPTVTVDVRRFGGWTVVDVAGEMDLQAVAIFADLSKGNSVNLVFQLQAVTFIDACGLGLLLESRRRALAAGGCVRLVSPSRYAYRLLVLTGSYRMFATFDSLLEAVTAPVVAVPQEVS
jgi:anti-anti-sigma factor